MDTVFWNPVYTLSVGDLLPFGNNGRRYADLRLPRSQSRQVAEHRRRFYQKENALFIINH